MTTQRVIGYVRVSTQEQVEGFGLAVQRDGIRAYCKERGLRLVDIAADEGISGSNGLDTRPGLTEALLRVEDHEVSGIVVYRLDRLARDLLLQETILAQMRRCGGEVLSVSEPDIDSDDPTRILVRQVLGAISQYERAMIRRRTTAGRAKKIAAGGYGGGRPKYGYKAEGGELIPAQDEQAVIVKVSSLRAQGMSLREDCLGAQFRRRGASYGGCSLAFCDHWCSYKRVTSRTQRIQAVAATATQVAAPVGAVVAASGGLWQAMVSAGASSALMLYASHVAERQSEVFVRAAQAAAVSQEELIAAFGSSVAKQELLVEALEAARTATSAAKRVALAVALATGAGADEETGEVTRELMIVRAIDDLDSPHLAVLAKLGEPPLTTETLSASGAVMTRAVIGLNGWRGLDELRGASGVGELTYPILNVLEGHGLIEQYVPEGHAAIMPRQPTWRLTPHGRLLMDHLSETQPNEPL